MRFAAGFVVALAAVAASQAQNSEARRDRALNAAGDIEFFEKEVRPLLAKHCFMCHSGKADEIRGGLRLDSRAAVVRGGETGPAILPGEPDLSALIRAIEYDRDLKMPPESKLAADKIAILNRWVQIGAPWPNSPSLPTTTGGEFPLEQRTRDHWCWRPISDPPTPYVADANWPLSPMDSFLMDQLQDKMLTPAKSADRRTWLRRVSFDLIGLPPMPAEVEGFLTDDSPLAYEKAVDRLLGSPHFGEHWARHWMDLVRYAETKGFEADYTMPWVYRYRDYLVRAFNSDVPYDQFVRESIAGDLLPEPRCNISDGSVESVAGPGYFYLFDSHHGPPDIHDFEARAFDNMIDTTSKTFLALTLACARCHDHKFDAITTQDYYSLYGILAGSRFHYANTVSPDVLNRSRQRLAATIQVLKHQLVRTLLSEIQRLRSDIDATGSLDALSESPGWNVLTESDIQESPLEPAVKLLLADSNELQKTWNSLSAPERGSEPSVPDSTGPSRPAQSIGGLSRASFGRWLPTGIGFGSSPVTPGAFTILKGDKKPKVVLACGAAAGLLSSCFDGALKSPSFILEDSVSVRIKGRHARVRLFVRHYELVGLGPTTSSLDRKVNSDTWHWISFDTRLWKGQPAYLEVLHNGDEMEVVYLKQHEAMHSNDAFVAIDRAVLGGRPDDSMGRFERAWRIFGPAPVSHSAAAIHVLDSLEDMLEDWRNDQLSPAGSEIVEALLNGDLFSHLLSRNIDLARPVENMWTVARAPPQPVYVRTLADGHGQDEPVYIRGNHKSPARTAAPRHFLDALDEDAFVSSGSGRREWADALVHPENPLTARVIVNRVWAHMFGRGIVATVDNFGVMGESPSHPQLLDHLAYRFIQDGWSLKHLIRCVSLSRMYRMSSRVSPRARQIDPDNIRLSHMPIRRLSAESIRDAILSASGRLNRQMYGESIPLDLTHATPSRAKPTKNGPTDGNGRRSVYLEVRRNYPSDFLRAFDQPDATAPRGRRAITNVPAQALSLMNDPFIIEQSHVWAARIATSSGDTLAQRVHKLHLAAFGRPADESELRQVETIVAELAAELNLNNTSAINDVRVWTEICHLMINRKEFVFVF